MVLQYDVISSKKDLQLIYNKVNFRASKLVHIIINESI